MVETRRHDVSQPQMREAVAAHDYGKVVRLARRARGLTQQELGVRAGYSAATISRLETGHQALDDITTLRILARVLDIPPSWLGLSSPPAPEDSPAGRSVHPRSTAAPVSVEPHLAGEDDAVKRRRFLAGLTGLTGAALLAGPQEAADAATMAQRLERFLTTDTAGTPATMTELHAALDVARTTFDACRYGDLSIMLPRVAATAQATLAQVEGRERDQVNACLADAYMLTSELAVKLNQDGMAWVAADRALATATSSGEPFAIAGASRAVAIAMRRQGRHEGAVGMLTRTALDLGADRGTPEPQTLQVYAALLCTAAYSCAQNGLRAQSLDLVREAEQAAGRLPEATSRGRLPTPANVAVYRVGIHTALGEPGVALDHARGVNHRLLTTPERHARWCVDTARAWEQFGRRDRAVTALLAAERTAPQEIRRPAVATLISGMRYGTGPVPSELHALAIRNGMN